MNVTKIKLTEKATTKAIESGYEVCICAAIQYRSRTWRGHRHGDAMDAQQQELSYTMNRKELATMCTSKEQGFITNKNRYVGRDEGRDIQTRAGIPSAAPDGYRGATLYSEDLY